MVNVCLRRFLLIRKANYGLLTGLSSLVCSSSVDSDDYLPLRGKGGDLSYSLEFRRAPSPGSEDVGCIWRGVGRMDDPREKRCCVREERV